MPVTVLVLPRKEIAQFCRRPHVRTLSVFGSVLRPDFRPDSDLDVLVELEANSLDERVGLGNQHLR